MPENSQNSKGNGNSGMWTHCGTPRHTCQRSRILWQAIAAIGRFKTTHRAVDVHRGCHKKWLHFMRIVVAPLFLSPNPLFSLPSIACNAPQCPAALTSHSRAGRPPIDAQHAESSSFMRCSALLDPSPSMPPQSPATPLHGLRCAPVHRIAGPEAGFGVVAAVVAGSAWQWSPPDNPHGQARNLTACNNSSRGLPARYGIAVHWVRWSSASGSALTPIDGNHFKPVLIRG
jgi:hypothetical protein